jgi:hypothetical protein
MAKLAVKPGQRVWLVGPVPTMFVGGRQMIVEIALNRAVSCDELVV